MVSISERLGFLQSEGINQDALVGTAVGLPLRVANARLARLRALSTGTLSRSAAGGKLGMGSLGYTTRGVAC